MVLDSRHKSGFTFFAKAALLSLILFLGSYIYGQALPDSSQPKSDTNSASELVVDAAVPVSPPVIWKLADVQSMRKDISESETLKPETKAALLEVYDEAITQLKLSEQYQQQKTRYQKLRTEEPNDLENARAELAKPVSEKEPNIPSDLKLTQLEQKVTEAKNTFEDIQKQALLLENEPKRRVDRKTKIPEELTAAKEQLDQVKQNLAGFKPDPSAPEMSQVKKMLLEINYHRYLTNIEALKQEQSYYDISGPLLTLQRDLATRRLAQAEKQLKALESALKEKRRIQAKEIKAQAEQAVEKAKYALPVIKQLAEEYSNLAKMQTEVVREIESATRYGKALQEQLNSLESDFEDVREKLQAAKEITNVMGMLLLSKRGDLPDIRPNIEKINSREGKAAMSQLMWAEYDKKWADLTDSQTRAKQILSSAGITQSTTDYSDLLEQTVNLLVEQRKIIRKISDDYLDYSEVLAQNDLNERKFVEVANEYRYFINENILWVRSSTVLKPDQLDQIIPALSWLVSPSNFRTLAHLLWKDIGSNPIIYILFIFVIIGLFIIRKNTLNKVKLLTDRSGHKYSDSFKNTFKTLELTITSSLAVPSIFLFLAWRMHFAASGNDFTRAYSQGFFSVGFTLAVYIFLRNFCISGGLGTQLGFSNSALQTLRKYMVWFFSIIIPVVFIVDVYKFQQTDTNWHDTAGRVFFMIEQIILSTFLLIVFRPKGKLLADLIETQKGGFLDRYKYLWYGACIVVPLSFIIVAHMGYYYAAQHLHRKLVLTVYLIAIAVLINAMMKRWFAVFQERIEIRQRKTRLQSESSKDETEDEIPVEEDYKTLLDSVFKQKTRLLRLVNVLVVIIGFWYIWKDVLPALGILENIPIWTTSNATGAPIIVTASRLAAAILIILLTIITSRNLPGLLEIVILQRLPFEKGISFAITTIFRYIIIVVGVILAFNRIGIGWSKVQWLVAAMSLGLGFGLQEIFANFVSGLIILFEQPIRVGDMVTIGDFNGRVTRIRIRSTTLRKYDQKELVVPNKEFVTGRLINWSLSDKTLRMDFTVGVAYGSDIKKTEETLMRIANEHPLVIHDKPLPVVIFSNFGDSSLEFQLRLFVPNMDNYLKVWHEINCAIDTEFRKEKIEIAFPQRDLHLRSADIPIPIINEANPKI